MSMTIMCDIQQLWYAAWALKNITPKSCSPRRFDLNPQLVNCFARVSPMHFCQFGTTLASDTGHTIAVSVARLTLAVETCGCQNKTEASSELQIISNSKAYSTNHKTESIVNYTAFVIWYRQKQWNQASQEFVFFAN